jgi:hypothetical protein
VGAEADHKDCPECTRIDEVGLLTAAQRLYKQYWADVLEVIEGHQLPPTKDAVQTEDQTANIICANKVAIEKLRPLLAIFEVSWLLHFTSSRAKSLLKQMLSPCCENI